MRTSKFTETQIITILKQGDAGLAVKDLCRQAGISTATYYQWKRSTLLAILGRLRRSYRPAMCSVPMA